MRKIKLLLLALLFTAIPTVLFAYTDGQIVPFNNNHYKVVSSTNHTLYFLGTDDSSIGQLVIPATINDGQGTTFTVIGVEHNTLYRCKSITSVKLPETITFLGKEIFVDAQLETINIPKSVTTIENNVWTRVGRVPKHEVDSDNPNYRSDASGALYSKNMEVLHSVPSGVNPAGGVYTVDSRVKEITKPAFRLIDGLKKIILPKDLQEVEEGFPTISPTETLEAFEIASGGNTPFKAEDGVLLKDAVLVVYPPAKPTEKYKVPDNITTIARYAISNTTELTEIDLNNVEKLNVASIYKAAKLTKITLPKDIKTYNSTTMMGMAEGCFESCTKVTEYIVPTGNTDFLAEDGVVYSKPAKDVLYLYPPDKAGTTYAIPSSVKKLAQKCFQAAQNITSMNIPSNVEKFEQEAFRDAPKFETVTFEEPSKIEELGYHSFRHCQKLTTVTFPKSLKKIGLAFYECSDLKTVNVPDESQLEEIADNAFNTSTKLKEFNFQGSCKLKTIGENAFANLKELEKFEFPKTVTEIKTNAFSGCGKMTSVTFDPDAEITEIGAGAFADCGLQSISIPKNVTKIAKEAFRRCKALMQIDVTEATTDIDPLAFQYCENLDAINVAKDNTKYSSVDGYLLSKDKEELILFPPGKANSKFTLLPPSIKKIGDNSFFNCEKLANVIIPNKVESIGKRAFGLCKNLKIITFLCDKLIDPANINQAQNEMSFDDGTQAPNMFEHITIHVRKELYNDYNAHSFYNKFNGVIEQSFLVGTEEYIPVSETVVDLLKTESTDHTFVLPTSVKHPTKNKTYSVNLIGDYAFQKTTDKVKEVVVKKDIEYIGAQAFVTDIANKTSTVKNVFFIEGNPTKKMLSTTRFELDETNIDYSEFAKTTKIYVKKSACEKYKEKWNKQIYDIPTHGYKPSPFNFTDQIDYKIPGVTITHKYGTFAREFDTDFSVYNTENGNSNVAAFVSKLGDVKQGNGDYGTSTYYIRMKSVDENGGVSGKYGYIPANTGVLLKVLDQEATSNGFYYAIGEHDDATYTISNNIMTGITVNSSNVPASVTDPVYVMQGGIFKKATTPINPFSIHHAYAKIPNVPAGAKLMFVFSDDNTTTGITTIDTKKADDNVYYNLNGQRVTNPQHGVFIHGGRKVIIK